MSWFKRGWRSAVGVAVLGIETVRIISELGIIKATSGALGIWQIYEFARDHFWAAAEPMLNFINQPLVHFFLIAAGIGFIVWDNRREKNKEIPPPPIDLGLPAAAAPTSPPVEPETKPAPRALSTYEAELKVKSIDKVLEILTEDMDPIIAMWPRLTNWFNVIKSPAYNPIFRQELMALRNNFTGAALKLDNLRDRLPQYQDVVVAAQPALYYNELIAVIERYMSVFMHVQDSVKKDAPDEALRTFMDQPAMQFDRAMTTFITWRNTARSEVLELRRAISP
jgi:hypothetical protein